MFGIQAFQRWALVFVLCFPITLCAADFDEAPTVQQLVEHLKKRLAAPMDARTGGGTGDLAREVRQFALELKEAANKITLTDAERLGFTIDNIERMAKELNAGQAWNIYVHDHAAAIARGNQRMHAAGIKFYRFVQSPEANLIELYREFIARFPTKKVTAQDLRVLSSRIYPDLADGEIRIPVMPQELSKGEKKLADESWGKFTFAADPKIQTEEEVVLPSLDEPRVHEKKKYAGLQRLRNLISPALAVVAGLSPHTHLDGSTGISFDEGATPSGAGGLVGAALEVQFIKFSNRWAWFWNKFGIPGNIAVNLAYSLLVAGAATTTEIAMGQDISTNLSTFLVKNLAIGTTTFVASFGASQIMMSGMRERGELSEWRRFMLETGSVLWNNFGRILAVAGTSLGIASAYETELLNIKFDAGNFVGYGIQLAYLATLTAPFALKVLWGDAAYDRITNDMLTADSINHQKMGPLTSFCSRWLGWAADWYTPRRNPKKKY